MAHGHLAVRRIRCTQCGAPLALYGGHKVETITCSYCGSILDPHDALAVLAAHRQAEAKRAHLPLGLGDRGTLWGVEMTVIGLITYRADGERWTDFCLFSPTHGYVWLSWQVGHFVLMRRRRDLPTPRGDWQRLDTKQKIWMGAREYRLFEAYSAQVVDVAGELPWWAEVGDTLAMGDAVAPPYALSQEREGEEVEYYEGEYLAPAAIEQAFGLERALPKPQGVHPAQPYRPRAFDLALGSAGRLFGGFAVIALLYVLLGGRGETILTQRFDWPQISGPAGAASERFEVTDADRLLKLKLRSPVDNGWLWLDLALTRGGETFFEIGKEISYYHGVEGGESWSEGSRTASTLLEVPEPGSYGLRLRVSESGGSQSQLPVTVEVRQGVLLARWLVGLVVVTGIAALWPAARRATFEKRRWAPVAEDDE